MTNPPPTLLTLPFELRSAIFHLTLVNTPEVCTPDPPHRRFLDLSLLSTNRQVYYETREIPIALHYFGAQYDPKVNFLSSLSLRPFQIAALKELVIEYLNPRDLAHFLALGRDNGYLFGDQALDLDLLVIYADDWIAEGARRWRYAASPEDVHYGLPRSSRWLTALCGLKGWKQLEVAFKPRELMTEHWQRGGLIQCLFDDFRSHLGDIDEDFTIWHESQIVGPSDKITVLRTKDLGRFKRPQWWRRDLGRLAEGGECVFGESIDINDDEGGRNEDEGGRPAFHVQERFWGPLTKLNLCTRCQTRRHPE